jgi:hypothetical protein
LKSKSELVLAQFTNKKSPHESELNLIGGWGQNRTADTRIFKGLKAIFPSEAIRKD